MHRKLFLILLPALGLLGACVMGDPMRVPYAVPSTPDDNPLLMKRGPIALRTLDTGWVRVPRNGMLNLERPAAAHLPDDDMNVRVFAHLLRHHRLGDFLIDSGLDESFRRGGNIKGILASNYVRTSGQQPGRDIATLLRAAGADVQAVFLTHLHGDHTSGIPALSKKIRFIAGKGDKYINLPWLYYGNHLDGVARVEEIDFRGPGSRKHPVLGRVVDLLGDGSLWAISTPGHSAGHVSYLANTTRGPVLFLGDASHTRFGFEKGVEPGWADDREAAHQSLARLRAFAKANPSVHVQPGHEY